MPFPDSPQHPASAVSHSLQLLPESFGALHLQKTPESVPFTANFRTPPAASLAGSDVAER